MTRSVVCALLLIATIASSARADVFRILDDPRDAAQARVDLFQQARSEIDALYFLARNDRVTLTALALLRDAHRRGVGTVRLIVDAGFQHIPRAVLAHLSDEGVEIKVYHPLTLRHPSWLFRRMHEKVVVVDRRYYIAGGRNLGEAYFGLARRNYVDRDVYIDGPSAADATQHFANLWSSSQTADLEVRVSTEEKRRAEMLLDDARSDLVATGFIHLDTGHDWSLGQKQVASVRFLHDPLVPDAGPRVADGIAEALEGAEKSIVIESPYLVPSKSLLELLDKKLRKGVRVLMLTNSLRSSDGVLPYAAFLKYRRRLVRAGVDVREFKGPSWLHAKSVVVDGRVALVGSYNVDPRSENLNTEVMCMTEDEEVAGQLLASIDGHLENAWRIARSGSAPPGERYPPVSHSTFLRIWAVRFILPVIEGQL
jgi:putative cardiolipin synthase